MDLKNEKYFQFLSHRNGFFSLSPALQFEGKISIYIADPQRMVRHKVYRTKANFD